MNPPFLTIDAMTNSKQFLLDYDVLIVHDMLYISHVVFRAPIKVGAYCDERYMFIFVLFVHIYYCRILNSSLQSCKICKNNLLPLCNIVLVLRLLT